MQNRNMFPFRRQGPKKRNKNNNARRVRGAPKGLPNSARDLLPVLQPATKALAQMLAGRTNVSGQLAHAQSVLAHAERLIAERTHNRLNPSEREEFFEQLARLRLTIADAEAEAEVVAAEEQQPKPAVVPVDQERLRAMALALTRPAEDPAAVTRAADAPEETPGGAGPEASPEPSEASLPAAPAPEDEQGRESRVSAANARSGRLQLTRPGDDDPADLHGAPARGALGVRRTRPKPAGVAAAADEPAGVGGNGSEAATLRDGPPDAAVREPAAPPAPRRRLKPEPQPQREADEEHPAASGDEPEGNGAGLAMRRPRRRKTAGLPDGWVIDDEGFVVPGPR